MSTPLAVRYLSDGTNEDALLLKEAWSNRIYASYDRNNLLASGSVEGLVERKVGGDGRDWKGRYVAEVEDPTNYRPGPEITGETYAFDEYNITIDDYLIKSAFIPEDEMEDWQWETMGPLGDRMVEKFSRLQDKRAFVTLTAAARTAALTKTADGVTLEVHPGGNSVEVTAASIQAAYPATKTGASQLLDHIAQIRQNMAEDDVPEGTIVGFANHYIHRVLHQAGEIHDSDLSSETADLNGYMVGKVMGVNMMFTNNLPSTDIGAYDLGGTTTRPLASKYQIDCSVGGAVGQPAILFASVNNGAGPAALGYVSKTGFRTFVDYLPENHGTRIIMSDRYGYGVQFPPATAELRVKSS